MRVHALKFLHASTPGGQLQTQTTYNIPIAPASRTQVQPCFFPLKLFAIVVGPEKPRQTFHQVEFHLLQKIKFINALFEKQYLFTEVEGITLSSKG